jgi:hexokinase
MPVFSWFIVSVCYRRVSWPIGTFRGLDNDESNSNPFENLEDTFELFQSKLKLKPNGHERELIRRTAELIGTRAARRSACGVAAISKKKGYDSCHVDADGSIFNKYPTFKARGAQALREILDWQEKKNPEEEDPIEILAAEYGSGVGAALIAALTLKRVKEGNLAGILHPENFAS